MLGRRAAAILRRLRGRARHLRAGRARHRDGADRLPPRHAGPSGRRSARRATGSRRRRRSPTTSRPATSSTTRRSRWWSSRPVTPASARSRSSSSPCPGSRSTTSSTAPTPWRTRCAASASTARSATARRRPTVTGCCGARRSRSRSTRSSTSAAPTPSSCSCRRRPAPRPRGRCCSRRRTTAASSATPITKTLTEPAPTPATLASSPERDVIEQLTGNARYSYKIQDVNGAPVLVLDAPVHVTAESRAALERARRRLDTLDYYPHPIRMRHVRLFVAPWFFRAPAVPPVRRVRGALDDPAAEAAGAGRSVRRPRDARALPRLADAAPPRSTCRSPTPGSGTRRNRYEAEARRAADETRA